MRNSLHVLLEWYHSLNIRPPITAALIIGTCAVIAAGIKAPANKPTQVKVEPQMREALAKPAVTTPPAQQAKSADPYVFTQAVIRSLAIAADARKTLISTKITGEGAADTLRAMTDARIAINKLQHAKLELDGFANDDNEAIATATQGFNAAYDALTKTLNDGIGVQERLVSVSSERELAPLLTELSRLSAQTDEAWKLLIYAAAAVTYALVDDERLENGEQVYLKITAGQRATLLDELESYFGDSVKQGLQAGQYATEAAPAALWQFLNEPWRPADVPAS